MIYLCVTKSRHTRFLDAIWSKGRNNDFDCKDSICKLFRVLPDVNEENWENEIYENNEVVIVNEIASTATPSPNDAQVVTINDVNMDIDDNVKLNDEPKIVCNVNNLRVNPFDNVLAVKEVSDYDLLHHFELMRSANICRRVLNQLRRKRQRLRHTLINQEKSKLGLPLIPFKDLFRFPPAEGARDAYQTGGGYDG